MKVTYFLPLLLILTATHIHNAKGMNNQQSPQPSAPKLITEQEERELSLFAPVKFTSSGLRRFFRNAYNNSDYSQEILPNNFSHFIQFLEYGLKTNQSRAYIKSVFKLFGNKVKALQYINAEAFADMIAQMGPLLEPHFTLTKATLTATYKETVNAILVTSFLSQFDAFKNNPGEFLDGLSQQIVTALQTNGLPADETITIDQLRQSAIRFLELCMTKLVWSPAEYTTIWDSVKKITNNIELLTEKNVIADVSDLDDLFWSLIHRFCFFLDLTATDLPVSFYEEAKKDGAYQRMLLFDLEEQESFIESKLEHFKRVLMECEAKRRALESGIIPKQ